MVETTMLGCIRKHWQLSSRFKSKFYSRKSISKISTVVHVLQNIRTYFFDLCKYILIYYVHQSSINITIQSWTPQAHLNLNKWSSVIYADNKRGKWKIHVTFRMQTVWASLIILITIICRQSPKMTLLVKNW